MAFVTLPKEIVLQIVDESRLMGILEADSDDIAPVPGEIDDRISDSGEPYLNRCCKSCAEVQHGYPHRVYLRPLLYLGSRKLRNAVMELWFRDIAPHICSGTPLVEFLLQTHRLLEYVHDLRIRPYVRTFHLSDQVHEYLVKAGFRGQFFGRHLEDWINVINGLPALERLFVRTKKNTLSFTSQILSRIQPANLLTISIHQSDDMILFTSEDGKCLRKSVKTQTQHLALELPYMGSCLSWVENLRCMTDLRTFTLSGVPGIPQGTPVELLEASELIQDLPLLLPKLERLTVIDVRDLHTYSVGHILQASRKRLKYFQLAKTSLEARHVEEIFQHGLTDSVQMQELVLDRVGNQALGFSGFGIILSRLRSLQLTDCRGLCGTTLALLLNGCKQSLQRCKLESVALFPGAWHAAFDVLCGCEQLKNLVINACSYDKDTALISVRKNDQHAEDGRSMLQIPLRHHPSRRFGFSTVWTRDLTALNELERVIFGGSTGEN